MAHFAIEISDGSVAIMETVGDVRPEDCIAKWHPDIRARVVRHVQIQPNELPKDRASRKRWKLSGAKVVLA